MQVLDPQQRVAGGRSSGRRAARRRGDGASRVGPERPDSAPRPALRAQPARPGRAERRGAGRATAALGSAPGSRPRHGHVAVRLLGVRQVTGLLEQHPLGCGMRSAMSSICIGVASSWRPLVSSTGTVDGVQARQMSQSRSVPTTWNSVGPFMVR